uniref:Ig-like domain-containing protein n=1 Tax=Anabas testudineus TaxID=64144 RepID=A0A3Q1H734_ANATE
MKHETNACELLLFQTFETKTVSVGENVKLTCPRQSFDTPTTLYWIRLVSGKLPDFLGGTFSFNHPGVNDTPRITAKQEPGTFILKICKTELSDTGLYYYVTAVIQDPISYPVRPGDSVTLQCSVLSDSDSKSCPTDHSVYWFRAGSDESHLSLIYFHGNSNYQCEKSPEPLSSQSCVYRFSKTVSSPDAGTYYCAVATCGQILFGNGTKLDTECKCRTFLYCVRERMDLEKVFACVSVYIIINRHLPSLNVIFIHLFLQIDKDSLAYSAPTFIRRKEADRTERKKATRAEEETLYSDIRAVVRK